MLHPPIAAHPNETGVSLLHQSENQEPCQSDVSFRIMLWP